VPVGEPGSPAASSIEALYAAARIIGSGADLPVIAAQTLEVIQTTTRMDAGTMFRFDRATDTLHLIAHCGIRAEHVEPLRVRRVEESALRDAIRTGRSSLVPLRHAEVGGARMREVIDEAGYRTLLALPIPVEGETWGIMSLVSRDERRFSPEILRRLEAVAHQVGLAVARASLYTEERARRAHLAALLEITKKIGALAPTDALLSSIADEAARLLGVGNAGFRLREDDELVLAGLAGDAAATMPQARIKVGESLSGRVVESGQTIRCAFATAAGVLPAGLAAAQGLGYTHFLGVPLRLGERTLGVLTFRARRPFTDFDQELAEAFAGQAAVAIEHARLYHEATRRGREAGELAALAGSLTQSLKVEDVAERIIDALVPLFGARSANLRLIQPDGSLVVIARDDSQSALSPRGDVVPPGFGISSLVLATGRPFRTADVFAEPDVRLPDALRARIVATGDRAYLAVPLRAKDRIIGVVLLGDRQGREFSEAEATLLQSFADQAALALENARLYEETDRRRREAEVLAEVAGSINASLDLATVLARVSAGARDLCGSDVARILLREPDSDAVVTRASVGHRTPALEALRIEPGKGVGGVVLVTGKPFRTANYAEDPRIEHAYQAVADDEGLVATMAVPIVIDGRVEGIIHVDNRDARGFTDQDEAILARLADHAAVAIRNARLYRETSDFAERLRALDEVNRLVSSSLNPDEVLQNIAAAAARFFDAPWVSMWVVDEARQCVVRSFIIGGGELAGQLPTELAIGQGAVGWVAAHRQPLYWTGNEDERIDPGVGARFQSHGLLFRLAYPIMIGERVLGVFAVNRATAVTVTPETEALLRSLAAQAALALDHARLFSETARRLEETRAMLDVAEILNSTLDSKQLLKRVAIRIAQICRVDRCSIQRWDGTRMVPLMSQFADGRPRPEMWSRFAGQQPWTPRQVPAHQRVIETRRPVVIHDTSETDLLPPEWIAWFQLKSWMSVPLVRQDQVIGVLNLDYCERATRFEDWQVDLAMTIAGQLALSLENIRLYAEVQERLRETQTLLAVAETLSQPGTPDDIMRKVAREVGRATTADMVGAYFMNERKDALVVLAGYHVPPDLLSTLRDRQMRLASFPFIADALSMGRAMWSADPIHDPRFDPAWTEGLPPHAVLFVPTLVQGQPLGGLFLVWWQAGRPFPAAEVPLVEGVATQVGLALENAELSRQTRGKLRETEALLSVSRALASTLDLEAMLRHFMREAARTLGADTMAFWTVAEDGEWLEPFAGYHVPPERLAEFRTLRVSMVQHAFYADAVQRRRPALSTLGQDDPRLPAHMRAFPHKSQLFVPIVAKERVIGALGAVWWETSRDLSASELSLLEALGSQVGVAVENARLFTENRRQLQELSALYDLSRAVTGELDRAALVEAIHTHLERVMDVRNMVVLIRDEDANDIEVALRIMNGQRNDEEPRRYLPRGIGLMQFVLEEGQTLRTADYAAECVRRGVAPVAYGLQFTHWLGVPMKAGEHVLGALAVRNVERAYSEADERLLGNVADLAALALRSSRLYEERARAFGELSAAQDQLVRTEKLRALGEMASGVAHDFNNLLASILGRAQLLLQRIEEPRLRQWLQVIERSALDGAQTVRRLQEFTRIRRDQPFVAVDVNQVVRDALEITQSRWREEPLSRGIAIDVRTSLGEVPPIAGDPVELREALTNLILNAVDAMPDGGALSLRTGRVDHLVELSVSDTGVGMPESVRQRIFDPFYTTKGARGTGLGLSITYGILMRHRARVVVESEPGQGTSFRLAFEPGATVDVAESIPPVTMPVGAPMRCLVVDDEEAVGTVLGDVLESSGHSAVVLTSGAAAIDRFRREPFDVVFTDLAMPGLSGWQVARAVKATAPATPVFLVTGFGVELSAEERRAHGVDLVLSKPLNIQSILDALAFAATRQGEAG
jgi:GAF domain-containing protein/ActR/RegA family two-component response regulator